MGVVEERAQHTSCENALWGTFAVGGLSQVYLAICDKVLVLCELDEMTRFTCGRRWEASRQA